MGPYAVANLRTAAQSLCRREVAPENRKKKLATSIFSDATPVPAIAFDRSNGCGTLPCRQHTSTFHRLSSRHSVLKWLDSMMWPLYKECFFPHIIVACGLLPVVPTTTRNSEGPGKLCLHSPPHHVSQDFPITAQKFVCAKNTRAPWMRKFIFCVANMQRCAQRQLQNGACTIWKI